MNTVKSSEGIEIYTHRIYELTDEYISNLEDKKHIYNKQCFNGLIKYINKNIDKPDYNNIFLLNTIWDIYADLCYKYKNTVSIERYCLLIGICRQTFYNWINGVTGNDYSEELGCTRLDMMKKWDEESENSWQDDASTGNPGAMFVLKARRGWQETAPAQIPQNNTGITKTPEQIAAEMGVKYLSDQQDFEAPPIDFRHNSN